MKYVIFDGSTVEITTESKVRLVDDYKDKFPGYRQVVATLETYVEIRTDKGSSQIFSPSLIADVSGGKEITKEDLRPLVRDLLENMLPNLIERAVKDAIKDKLTDQFFQQVAATTVKAAVKTEVVAALRAGATAIGK